MRKNARLLIPLAPAVASVLAGPMAFAADFSYPASPPVLTAPAVFSWTGFYAGLNVGYVWGNDPVSAYAPNLSQWGAGSTAPFEAAIVGTGSMHPSGVIGGGQIGYNFQIDHYVLGLEGDVEGLDASSTRDSGYLTGFTTRFRPRKLIHDVDEVSYQPFATIRGRIGYAFDRVLIYATGGLAVTGQDFSRSLDWTYIDAPCPYGADGLHACHAGSISRTLAGWAIGGGIEYALTNNWTIRAEYLHADFGTTNFSTFNPGTSHPGQQLIHTIGDTTFDIARVGINYKFDLGGLAPAVIKY